MADRSLLAGLLHMARSLVASAESRRLQQAWLARVEMRMLDDLAVPREAILPRCHGQHLQGAQLTMPARDDTKTILVRDSAEGDLALIQEIYGWHVLDGFGSFEIEPPDIAEIGRRRKAVTEAGLPHLVAERSGEIVGFAYAAPYRTRPAYRATVEDSVYVAADQARRGVGRALLAELIRRCEIAGRREIIAIIGDSANSGSIALHESCGFRHVGTLERVGCKRGRWLDTVIMQRRLDPSEPVAMTSSARGG